jgi:tetratricopeptide (TPR) repeat protein
MFWDLDGHYREGRDWLRRVVADGRELTTQARAQALMGIVHLAVVRGDPDDEAAAACRFAVQLSRSAGDAIGLAHALQYLGFIALVARRLDEARQLLDEAEDTASRAGAALPHARTLLNQALLALLEQRFDDADTLAHRAESLNETVGDRGLLVSVVCLRAGLAARGGHLSDAARHLVRAIRALLSIGGRWDQPPGTALPQPRRSCLALHGAGNIIARAGGRETLVIRLYAAATTLREQVGPGVLFGAETRAEEVLASLRSRMEPDRFAHEWRSGQEMTTVDALNMALLALDSCQ